MLTKLCDEILEKIEIYKNLLNKEDKTLRDLRLINEMYINFNNKNKPNIHHYYSDTELLYYTSTVRVLEEIGETVISKINDRYEHIKDDIIFKIKIANSYSEFYFNEGGFDTLYGVFGSDDSLESIDGCIGGLNVFICYMTEDKNARDIYQSSSINFEFDDEEELNLYVVNNMLSISDLKKEEYDKYKIPFIDLVNIINESKDEVKANQGNIIKEVIMKLEYLESGVI